MTTTPSCWTFWPWLIGLCHSFPLSANPISLSLSLLIPSICRSLSLSLTSLPHFSLWKQAPQRRWPLQIGNTYIWCISKGGMPNSRTLKTLLATHHNRLGFEKHAGSAGERNCYERLFWLFYFTIIFFNQKSSWREEKKKSRLKCETLSIY